MDYWVSVSIRPRASLPLASHLSLWWCWLWCCLSTVDDVTGSRRIRKMKEDPTTAEVTAAMDPTWHCDPPIILTPFHLNYDLYYSDLLPKNCCSFSFFYKYTYVNINVIRYNFFFAYRMHKSWVRLVRSLKLVMAVMALVNIETVSFLRHFPCLCRIVCGILKWHLLTFHCKFL